MTATAAAPASADRAPAGLVVLAWTAAAAYVVAGIAAMLVLSPRVPYADPWRFLARYLSTPFPDNVLAEDNGHLELLPNLLRLAELEWFAANQWLQIGVGTTLALATWLLLASRFFAAAPGRRAGAALVVAIGWFWLGNARKLAHGNESVSLFLVVGSVLAGLCALCGDQPLRRTNLLVAGACGLAATLSFGAGFAAFGAFVVALWLRRAGRGPFVAIALAAALAVALLVAGGDRLAGEFALLARLDLLLRWLGAPVAWLANPLLDPEHAARLPWGWLRLLTEPVAGAAQAAFGPALLARWPAAAFGGGALVWLAWASLRHRRQAAPGPERLALGIAWFGVGVGVLVMAARLDYFHQYPEQVTTQRYLPWSMLVWTGLLLVATLRCPRDRRALWPALLALLLFTPSQVWTARFAWKQRAIAERTALGAAVGVLERGLALAETDENDLALATPLLRAAGAAMFAWPETRLLGQRVDGSNLAPVALAELDVQPVDNRFVVPGVAVQFRADEVDCERVLLLDAAGMVCGLAMRMPFDPTWHGYARGTGHATLRAAALR